MKRDEIVEEVVGKGVAAVDGAIQELVNLVYEPEGGMSDFWGKFHVWLDPSVGAEAAFAKPPPPVCVVGVGVGV